MKEINERIEWLEKAITALRRYMKMEDRTFSDATVINIIGEYQMELDALKKIRHDNISLFRLDGR